MKRKSQIHRLQSYLHDPDFWVFVLSIVMSIAVLNLPAG